MIAAVMEVEPKKEFGRGLTWRVILAMIISSALFIPTTIYVYLASGSQVATAIAFLMVILFAELSKLFGEHLSKQELFIIYEAVVAIVGSIPIYYWLVYRAYFVNTPLTSMFTLKGLPISMQIPTWLAPVYGSEAYRLRTLINPSWVPAITIYTILVLLTFLTEVSLSMIFSYLFIEIEELSFPFAAIDVALVRALTEEEEDRLKIFMVMIIFGFAYGAFSYVPQLMGAPLIPLPWIDLTHYTEKYLPGAIIGIATDPSSFMFGLLVSPVAASSMVVGSIVCWVAGNTLFITNFPNIFPDWSKEYQYGMRIPLIYQRSQLRVWFAPQIGFALGIACAVMIRYGKSITKMISRIIKPGSDAVARWRYAGFPPMWILVMIYLVGTGSSIAILHWLVPDIPLIIPITVSMVLSFFMGLFITRAVGEIGFTYSTPSLWHTLLYFSPYEGYPGWVTWTFSPGVAGIPSSPSMTNMVKAAYLTETHPVDYYEAVAIGTVLSLVFGFITIDFFWRIAPIPSSAYPYTLFFWPTVAVSDLLLVTRQININPTIIIISAMISSLIYAIGEIVTKITPLNLSPVALIMGFSTLPPYAIMIFLGSVLGKMVLDRIFGKEHGKQLSGYIVAGFLAGQGISVGIAICLILLSKAAWIWPW